MGDALAPWHLIILLVVAFVPYWVPTIVAVARKDRLPNVWPVAIINFFAGWTLIGWVVALVMACRTPPKQPQYFVPPGWVPGPGQQSQYGVPPGWVPGPGQQPPAPPTNYGPGPQ